MCNKAPCLPNVQLGMKCSVRTLQARTCRGMGQRLILLSLVAVANCLWFLVILHEQRKSTVSHTACTGLKPQWSKQERSADTCRLLSGATKRATVSTVKLCLLAHVSPVGSGTFDVM